jgi:hypothetical protein
VIAAAAALGGFRDFHKIEEWQASDDFGPKEEN